MVSLDLARLRSVDLDRTSLTARLGPGLTGPDAETALGSLGVTLGHFPQSFEEATIGGFAATRSAGQASSGYGRFDGLVTAVELSAPAGRLRTLQVPHTAAGPSLRELVLGSEGTLGVITEVTCRVRPAPDHRHYEGWIAADFEQGREIVRGSPSATRPPTFSGSPTRRRRGSRWSSPAPRDSGSARWTRTSRFGAAVAAA